LRIFVYNVFDKVINGKITLNMKPFERKRAMCFFSPVFRSFTIFKMNFTLAKVLEQKCCLGKY